MLSRQYRDPENTQQKIPPIKTQDLQQTMRALLRGFLKLQKHHRDKHNSAHSIQHNEKCNGLRSRDMS